MAADRQKRDPITAKHRVQGALIFGLWVAVPSDATANVYWAITNKLPEDILLSVSLVLAAALVNAVLHGFLFLPIGWLVEKNLAGKNVWMGYPFVLAGIGLALFFPALLGFVWGGFSEYLYAGALTIFGAHAGWRYYSWLSADRVIVI